MKKKPDVAAKAKAKKPAAAGKARKPATRADLGQPVDAWFAKQPRPQRDIAAALRALLDEVVPDAVGAIKWGMPFYTLDGQMMCAIAAFKGHVNLILSGPPGSYADPDNRLEGDGKTGRHLKLRTLDELPHATVRAWLRTAAKLARTSRD